MIYKIYASDKRFKAVEFRKGLNVILADRKEESGEKDSRNGLGKTTLINVLHFCFGSDLKKELLPINEISDWTFFIEFDLCGEKIIVSRSIKNAGIVKLDGNLSSFPIKPERDEKDGLYFFNLSDWRKLLGICLFGIPSTTRTKYIPTFRNLISYFIRTGIDAYSKPFTYLRNQNAWQSQVANAFLLGLNWEHASAVQELKDKDKAVKSLNNAIKAGVVLSKGELEAERVRLQRELDKKKKDLSSFKVYPRYQELQNKANSITKEIHMLSNKNLVINKKLERYKESVQLEKAPDSSNVTELYAEAGILFSDILKKKLEEARDFHNKIVQNRKQFLQVEIEEIVNQISINENAILKNTSDRAELMKILKTHGALDEFMFLQGKYVEEKERLEAIKTKIYNIQEISSQKKEIKAERVEVDLKIMRDYEQSRPDWEKAIAGFNENSLALYNEPGNLIINISDKGRCADNAYSFGVEISRGLSEGVGKMKIFCYDLMLVDLFSQRGKIDFLVHDSTMFDSVDSRQTAHALELAYKKGTEGNFQYICAFNSDMLPKSNFSKDFNIDEFVRLTLTDKDEKDCLMGFRFNE